jgi:hypothetical protein
MGACPLYSQRLMRLRKKLSSTATLGCASMIMAAKPAQARVAVLLKAALNRLFPQAMVPRPTMIRGSHTDSIAEDHLFCVVLQYTTNLNLLTRVKLRGDRRCH